MEAQDQWNEAGLRRGKRDVSSLSGNVPKFGQVRLNPRAAGPVLRGGQIVTLLCQLAPPITLDYTAHPFVNAYNRVASSAMVSLRC